MVKSAGAASLFEKPRPTCPAKGWVGAGRTLQELRAAGITLFEIDQTTWWPDPPNKKSLTPRTGSHRLGL